MVQLTGKKSSCGSTALLEDWRDGTLRDVVRDEKGRFVTWRIIEEPPLFFRASVGLNFVLHGRYYGALVQEWFDDEDEANAAISDLKKHAVALVEAYLGFPKDEWWFSFRIGWGIQEVPRMYDNYETIEEDLNAALDAEQS